MHQLEGAPSGFYSHDSHQITREERGFIYQRVGLSWRDFNYHSHGHGHGHVGMLPFHHQVQGVPKKNLVPLKTRPGNMVTPKPNSNLPFPHSPYQFPEILIHFHYCQYIYSNFNKCWSLQKIAEDRQRSPKITKDRKDRQRLPKIAKDHWKSPKIANERLPNIAEDCWRLSKIAEDHWRQS